MKYVWPLILCIPFGLPQNVRAQGSDDHPDYSVLSHKINVSQFRGGNHDSSGANEYYFNIDMFAILIDKKESKKEWEKRQKIPTRIGEIGDYRLNALSYWTKKQQEAEKIEPIEVRGEQIRELVSAAMKEFKVEEIKIAIKMEISLWEREKSFGLFGEDVRIGETTYYAIPETLPRRANSKDLKLAITDDKGTLVEIAVRYDLNGKRKR